jgi:hypothetical protein
MSDPGIVSDEDAASLDQGGHLRKRKSFRQQRGIRSHLPIYLFKCSLNLSSFGGAGDRENLRSNILLKIMVKI